DCFSTALVCVSSSCILTAVIPKIQFITNNGPAFAIVRLKSNMFFYFCTDHLKPNETTGINATDPQENYPMAAAIAAGPFPSGQSLVSLLPYHWDIFCNLRSQLECICGNHRGS